MEKPSTFQEYTYHILNCTAIDDVWALHTKKMKEYGFDRLLYASSAGDENHLPRRAVFHRGFGVNRFISGVMSFEIEELALN